MELTIYTIGLGGKLRSDNPIYAIDRSYNYEVIFTIYTIYNGSICQL